MKGYGKTLLTLLTLFAAVVALVTLRSRGQNVTPSRHGSAEDQVPVVDYQTPSAVGPERLAKNARYHGATRLGTVEELPLSVVNNHWFRFLPALPVRQSDAVVIGQIKGAQAYVSQDKTTAYSEYKVSVDEVLKSSGKESIITGSSIVAEREGAAVRFASGHVHQMRVIGQGIPRTGGRYVLFLKQNSEGQGYSIVTGYELRGGQVFPLDSGSINQVGNGANLPFEVYTEADENTFLNKLRNAIAESAQEAPEGR